jgi:hypothetical protein
LGNGKGTLVSRGDWIIFLAGASAGAAVTVLIGWQFVRSLLRELRQARRELEANRR